MRKNFIIGVIAGGLVFGAVGAFAGQYVATENPFPIKLNGENISIEGYNIDGSTYFKLRDVADAVGGFNVDFQDNTIMLNNITEQSAKIKDSENYSVSSNTVWIGDTGSKYHRQNCPTLKGNGHEISLDEAVLQGRTPCNVCY